MEKFQRNEDKAGNTYEHAVKLDVSKDVPEYEEIKNDMAMEYPFKLDPFQQQAVCCMEKGDSVFVAAHTSAGKTVVAEYAVALCKKNSSRVIYTSPIKALSNQKFRDFKKAFGDVGLITGDIQLHSDAYCLIMTTEILKSMLYNGSEVVRELEWVIFDEVHYINDIERGHVWEEVLIMLPSHVKIVMLSATVPNCLEFADWVGRIKNRYIYVIQTLKRPVPLVHHLYTGQDGKTKKDLFCIFKEGNFITSGYQKAVEAKRKKADSQKGGAGGPGRGGGWMSANQNHSGLINKNNKNIYINLIDFLRTSELLPMIVFIFSRQRCDETAYLLLSVDLTTASEKSAIHRFFNRCIDRLTGSDKELPQVLLMQEHCKRGFAVHHSGILPIIKEVVEMLFQQGLVKILFATETFAMGVNMPARTVVFDTIEKHDGKQKRLLNATEYVQMAGRAGRRGLDSTGTVIILTKGPAVMELDSLKRVLQGKPIKLESKFRMTYSMMLNLLRVEHMTIEDMLQSSYVERASLRMVLSKKDKLKEIDAEIAKMPQIECAFCVPPPEDGSSLSLSDYSRQLRQYFEAFSHTWTALIAKSSKDAKLFNRGRIVVIHHDPLEIVGRLAVVLETRSLENGQFLMTLFVPTFPNSTSTMNGEVKETVFNKGLTKEEQKWKKEALLLNHAVANGIEGLEKLYKHQSFVSDAKFTILEDIGLDSLMVICKKSIKNLSDKNSQAIIDENTRLRGRPNAQMSAEVERQTRAIFMEFDKLVEKFGEQNGSNSNSTSSELFHILGEETDKKELELVIQLREMRDRRQKLLDPKVFPCKQCPNIREHMKIANERRQMEEMRGQLAYQTSYESLQFSGEYAGRLKVLRALGYIDGENMVSVKGKLACEISNQELLITELILDNKFNDRTPAEIGAMFSALTCQFDGKISRKALYQRGNNGNGKMGQPAAANENGNGEGRNGGGGGGENEQKGEENGNGGGEQQQQTAKEKMVEEIIERVPFELLKELEKDLVEAAQKIDKIQRECGVNASVLEELKFGLMEVVHQWANGMEFAKIMRLSDAQEGIIVRCIQRLVEVCKDVRKAAMIVGNPELADKMEETSTAIRRDIVFAASLYVTED